MATADSSEPRRRRRPPATTPDGRERQLVSLAVDLVERQLREGTASAQVITHYLKLGSTREKLEQEKLRGENRLINAKVENLDSMKKQEELYGEALKAMSRYSGKDDADEEEYEE
jgi:hypothetical protein